MKLADRKTKAVFETGGSIRGRAIIAECYPNWVSVRLKGQRTRYEMSWEGLYYHAARFAAERLLAAKRRARARR